MEHTLYFHEILTQNPWNLTTIQKGKRKTKPWNIHSISIRPNYISIEPSLFMEPLESNNNKNFQFMKENKGTEHTFYFYGNDILFL